TENVLAQARDRHNVTRIDKLLLVGGATYMPQVIERMKQFSFEIAQYDPNQAVAKPITPSVVCFRDGAAIVGEAAKELQGIGYPTAAFFKRQMGDANWIFNADGVEHSATDLSALVLKQLKCDAEQALGSKITDAVITVPAYFRNAEREATIAAGRQADLNVL